MASKKQIEELVHKYLDAGGDPDYVVFQLKRFSPGDIEAQVISRKDYERIFETV